MKYTADAMAESAASSMHEENDDDFYADTLDAMGADETLLQI